MAPAQDALPLISVFGSLNIDQVAYVPHFPQPGETLTATSTALSPGGKGANQAVACAKLSRARPAPGADASASASAAVRMTGAVGADAHGALLRANLARHGVDAGGVRTADGAATGAAFITVEEPTGENHIVLAPGANHAVTAADAEAALDGADLLVMQLEVPLAAVEAAAAGAARRGVPVLLNPAPAVPLPEGVLAGLAHLVLNETEAAVLAPCAASELDTAEGLGDVARGFVGRGVGHVVITLGGRGVYYSAAGGGEGLVLAEEAKVVDTTAAGDTFVGQYALEVVAARGGAFDIEAAVRKANRAAAKTVERKGAQDSIPWRDELGW